MLTFVWSRNMWAIACNQTWNMIRMFPYIDVIMCTMVSHITDVSNVCPIVCSGADDRKHQSFASLAFMAGIYLWRLDSPHKGLVTWKMLPFDDVIMFESPCWLFDQFWFAALVPHRVCCINHSTTLNEMVLVYQRNLCSTKSARTQSDFVAKQVV